MWFLFLTSIIPKPGWHGETTHLRDPDVLRALAFRRMCISVFASYCTHRQKIQRYDGYPRYSWYCWEHDMIDMCDCCVWPVTVLSLNLVDMRKQHLLDILTSYRYGYLYHNMHGKRFKDVTGKQHGTGGPVRTTINNALSLILTSTISEPSWYEEAIPLRAPRYFGLQTCGCLCVS